MQDNYKNRLKNINTFIFDVDGVLTDSSLLITTEGELLRRMSVRDGYALKTALQKGYQICVITGGSNEGVKTRLGGLGVTDIYLGVHDKDKVLSEFLEKRKIDLVNVLYMGDDLPDIPAMRKAAVATCPQDAVAEVKAVCHYVSHRRGGEGCVRDIIEQVLKVRRDWYGNFDAKDT